jgi:hypothetical protein
MKTGTKTAARFHTTTRKETSTKLTLELGNRAFLQELSRLSGTPVLPARDDGAPQPLTHNISSCCEPVNLDEGKKSGRRRYQPFWQQAAPPNPLQIHPSQTPRYLTPRLVGRGPHAADPIDIAVTTSTNFSKWVEMS